MNTTHILYMDAQKPDLTGLAVAADALKNNQIVAFPTETIYGIGCSVHSKEAVRKIFKLKRRSSTKPLAICVAAVSDIEAFKPQISACARTIIDHFLPGPLTVLLRCEQNRILGFRVPAYPLLQKMIELAGTPIFATSANLSGMGDPVTAQEILKNFPRGIDVLIDAGPAHYGKSSTVLDLCSDTPVILREGAITKAELETVAGTAIQKKA